MSEAPPQEEENPGSEAGPESVVESAGESSSRSAQWVAAGIFLSRISGLVREAFIGKYLGTSYAADSFRTALRMPNVLQNLLGEGTLSASFIPVYAELLEEGREEEAGRVAGAVFALLFALAGALALVGIFAAPVLVSVFTPGFVGGPRYDLTVGLIRIIFPMAGVLVLSAWALGVLNSHRRFFVSYAAPVVWNAAMIAALLLFGARSDQESLAVVLSWAALLGGALQFLVQLPFVLRLIPSLKIRWDLKLAGVRTAMRNAGPAIAGRGVVQLSGYVDIFLASMLAVGAVATLTYAQQLYILPISLFGMSVAAAELPELSRRRGGGTEVLRTRVVRGLEQVAFYVVPTILGFLLVGDVIVGALYERGEFSVTDTAVTWYILGGLQPRAAGVHGDAGLLVCVLRAPRHPYPREGRGAARAALGGDRRGADGTVRRDGVCGRKAGAAGDPGVLRRPLRVRRSGMWTPWAARRWGLWGWRWPRQWPRGWSGGCCSGRWRAGSDRSDRRCRRSARCSSRPFRRPWRRAEWRGCCRR